MGTNVDLSGGSDYTTAQDLADLNAAAQSYAAGSDYIPGSSSPTDISSSGPSSTLLSSLGLTPSQLAGLVTGAAGISALTGGNTTQTGGYSGSIPNLVATRMQVPGASNVVTPGQRNQQYFTDTLYTDPSQQANAQALIQAQANAIAQNQTNAVVPTFAMPWQNIPGGQPMTGGISSLPAGTSIQGNPSVLYAAGQGATPATNASNTALTPAQLAAQQQAAAQAAAQAQQIAALQAQLAAQQAAAKNNATSSYTPQQISSFIQQIQGGGGGNTQIAQAMDQYGVNPAQVAAATGLTTAEIQNLYNQNNPNGKYATTTTAATPATTTQIQQQLQNAAASLNSGNTASGIAGLNNIIQANNLNASQIQAMFPGVDLSQYVAKGVNIPGYVAPTTTAATTTPNLGATIRNIQSDINSGALGTVNNPAGTAPTYTAYTPDQISSYIQQQGIANNPTAIAAAEQQFNVDPTAVAAAGYATGGGIGAFAHGGSSAPRYLQGGTDGMADKLDTSIDGRIPAKLSHGEFVIPADVVSHLGNGNSDAGANKLYQMMDRIRMARTGTKKQGKEINPDKFMLGGKAYASGGAVAFGDGGNIKGFDGTTGSSVTGALGANLTTNAAGIQGLGSTASNTLSPWAGNYVTNMLGQGQALANAPMPVYQGPLTAGQSALQNQQFAGLSQMAQTGYTPMNYQTQNWSNQGIGSIPNLSTPSETSLVSQAASGQPFTQTTGAAAAPTMTGTSPASQYMNPYLQTSLQPQLDALTYQAQQDQQSMLGNLTKQGAFGGSRQAVAQGVAQGNLLTNQANLIGQGYNTAYTNAMNQFNADQARQLQAQADTEASRQFSANQAQQTLAALGTAGGVQQGIQNAADQAAYQQFQTQQQYPYQQLQFEQSLLQGLPISTAVATPNQNAISSTAGTVSGLTGLYNSLANLPGSSGTTSNTSSGATNS